MKAHRLLISLVLMALTVSVLIMFAPTAIGQGTGNRQYLPLIAREVAGPSDLNDRDWNMAGSNPERTSWTAEEVRGALDPVWYRPIEPFIPAKIQLVAAEGLLFVSTARGLYALDAETGAEKWVYPTELPLGNSPTVVNGVAYVGGFDHMIHAVDVRTGQKIWTFSANAGFDTNPLVIDGRVYAGSRDGVFYAVYANGEKAGQLAWRFPASGSLAGAIHTSAAYTSGILYFAADDMYAYALNASNGSLVWKSARLPGAGFHSWWPVIYQNSVVLSGSSLYRSNVPPGDGADQQEKETSCLFPNGLPQGSSYIGEKAQDGFINVSKAAKCFEKSPWMRTYIVLDRKTGREIEFDLDGNSKRDYPPILWFGTRSGNRYPPVVGLDGRLYQATAYFTNSYSLRGQVAGWKFGTPWISEPSANNLANDEPIAYSIGGNVIYWNQCCDRGAGGFDLRIPNRGVRDQSREWFYFEYNLDQRAPGYDVMMHSSDIDAVYGGVNGVYGGHGDQNPPIPYRGKVYLHRGNAIIAFGSTGKPAVKLSTVKSPATPNTAAQVNLNSLKQKLSEEVEKILAAGHLRPGYGISGNFDRVGRVEAGDHLLDYWHAPGDSLYTLAMALPYLPADQQARTLDYMRREYRDYPPYAYVHTGWSTGAAREAFDLPPDVEAARAAMPAGEWTNSGFEGWHFPPDLFYALWKYAQVSGGAREIFNASKSRLEKAPSTSVLTDMPFVLNAYIAGYTGYLELEKLAGYPKSGSVETELAKLKELRDNTFAINSPFGVLICDPGSMSSDCYAKTLSVARNFMFLTPELAQYLRDRNLNQMQQAVAEYERVAPYWFAVNFEQTYAEGARQPIYDSYALFLARALILRESAGELLQVLDVPAVAQGDLYYIQKLVLILQAAERQAYSSHSAH